MSEKFEKLKKVLSSVMDKLILSQAGAWLCMYIIWHSTAKERKEIMKSCRDNVIQILSSNSGYFIFLALLDSVDDTVIMNKVMYTCNFNTIF
jgi:pumilio family protein 6